MLLTGHLSSNDKRTTMYLLSEASPVTLMRIYTPVGELVLSTRRREARECFLFFSSVEIIKRAWRGQSRLHCGKSCEPEVPWGEKHLSVCVCVIRVDFNKSSVSMCAQRAVVWVAAVDERRLSTSEVTRLRWESGRAVPLLGPPELLQPQPRLSFRALTSHWESLSVLWEDGEICFSVFRPLVAAAELNSTAQSLKTAVDRYNPRSRCTYCTPADKDSLKLQSRRVKWPRVGMENCQPRLFNNHSSFFFNKSLDRSQITGKKETSGDWPLTQLLYYKDNYDDIWKNIEWHTNFWHIPLFIIVIYATDSSELWRSSLRRRQSSQYSKRQRVEENTFRAGSCWGGVTGSPRGGPGLLLCDGFEQFLHSDSTSAKTKQVFFVIFICATANSSSWPNGVFLWVYFPKSV